MTATCRSIASLAGFAFGSAILVGLSTGAFVDGAWIAGLVLEAGAVVLAVPACVIAWEISE